MSAEVVLRAEEHFEGLRDAVWRRFRARHGRYSHERFEDAYAEWWTRELERAGAGRPSRAAAPVAFVAEAVHRVLIDEGRARARGLARGEKAGLEVVDLDDQLGVAHRDDTAATAHYEAVVHRVLELVRDRLSARELQVFVWSFLYLQTTERTAAALGLSEPRVKKDRKHVATKVGTEVWAVLSGELALCSAYTDKKLQAVFELLTDHVEDCPECAGALGGVRRGALAVVAPVELLVFEPALGLLERLVAKATVPLHRAMDVASTVPPSGRAAAAVAMAAAAVGGGMAATPRPATSEPLERPTSTVVAVATPAAPAAPAPPAVPAAGAEAAPVRSAAPARRERRRTERKRRPQGVAARPAATPAPVATPAATAAPPPAPVVTPVAAPPAPTPPAQPGGEFGFERR